MWKVIKPFPANLSYINFHPLEVVSRYSDTQLQAGENYSYLFNLGANICKSCEYLSRFEVVDRVSETQLQVVEISGKYIAAFMVKMGENLK